MRKKNLLRDKSVIMHMKKSFAEISSFVDVEVA